MKRIFLLLAFFSCFLIVSTSFIPSAQLSIVEEEIELRMLVNPIFELIIKFFIRVCIIIYFILAIIYYILAVYLWYVTMITVFFDRVIEILVKNIYIEDTLKIIVFLFYFAFFYPFVPIVKLLQFSMDLIEDVCAYLNKFIEPEMNTQILRYGIE
jgi:hypothetical protein